MIVSLAKRNVKCIAEYNRTRSLFYRLNALERKCSLTTGASIIDPLIGLNTDQSEYYNISRTFADKELRPYAGEWDKNESFPLDTFRKLATIGFAGMYASNKYGGGDLSRSDTIPIIEGLASGCVATTAMLTIHNACTSVIDKFGSVEQREKYVAKLCSTEMLISFCLTEPGSGSDAASLVTKAVYDASANEYIISGGKVFISGAGQSDIYLVMCRTGDGFDAGSISCILVPKGTPGLSFGKKERKMGWNCQPTRQVNFDEVRVPASNRLSAEGHGFKIAMSTLDGARLSIGACSVGAAQRCFEIALDYTKQRKQFQHPVATFQATQFKFADMAGKIMSSRLMLR